MRTIACIFACCSLWAAAAGAQWATVPDRALSRAKDGTPDLAGPVPKAPDGRPDLSGVWLANGDPPPPNVPFQQIEGDVQFSRHFFSIAADLKPGAVELVPWAGDLYKQRFEGTGKDDPAAHCLPAGPPFKNVAPLPYKIVQTPSLVLVLYEEDTVFRQIFLDARKPVDGAVPRWLGYSTGKWQGDTLVVDTVGFHDKGYLDALGHPHSDGLHLIERFRRPVAGHLEIETTIDDPRAYLKPITYTVKSTLQADQDLLEYFCTENEKDAEHLR